jgi:hypothetical protein
MRTHTQMWTYHGMECSTLSPVTGSWMVQVHMDSIATAALRYQKSNRPTNTQQLVDAVG